IAAVAAEREDAEARERPQEAVRGGGIGVDLPRDRFGAARSVRERVEGAETGRPRDALHRPHPGEEADPGLVNRGFAVRRRVSSRFRRHRCPPSLPAARRILDDTPRDRLDAVITNAHGKICYVEMPASDPARSAEFYRAVFGWTIRTRGDGAT